MCAGSCSSEHEIPGPKSLKLATMAFKLLYGSSQLQCDCCLDHFRVKFDTPINIDQKNNQEEPFEQGSFECNQENKNQINLTCKEMIVKEKKRKFRKAPGTMVASSEKHACSKAKKGIKKP